MNTQNRLYNSKNPAQGTYKKVLCVCSAGLLRSPTVALVLSSPPYNFNTRAAGLDASFALIPVDDALIEWADEIVCMDNKQCKLLIQMSGKPTHCLNLMDCYNYRDPKLIKIVKQKVKEIYGA